MYDISNMQRHSTYTYPQYAAPPPQKHYPTTHSTSSAFSASANPNEDWTKISDLAERRRIQNRIAQRNYRKKLKKRLEDLERRAGSSSASPEQRHEELPQSESLSPGHAAGAVQRQRSNSSRIGRERTPEVLTQQYVLPPDDRLMFSQQYTRQLSTSPPPFSYASMPSTETMSYSTYPTQASYCAVPANAADMSIYQQYSIGMQQTYAVPSITSPPIKQEGFYGDDEINPFSMSYAAINEMPSYQDIPPYTPPLSDSSSEHWHTGSPPDYPRTPGSLRSTPPLSVYERV